jgi:hypothetical protein
VHASRDFLRLVDRSIVVERIFSMLVAGVTCLKHEGFREELTNSYLAPDILE